MRSEPTITVTGSGEAKARPDEARLVFTVLRQAETAKAAVDAASNAMTGVIAGMREVGAEDRDLQTATVQITPRYDANDQTRPGPQTSANAIVGYDARNTLTVIVRNIEEVGSYLDRAIDRGVNEGGDVSFTISDDEALLAEARRKAVADARAKAELYAEAAGVALGDVRSIAEPGNDGPGAPMPMMRMAADSSSGVPIEAGELTRSASIQMVFDLRPADQR